MKNKVKPFLDDDFVLDTETAKELYHGHAKNLPIIDYHCHLDPSLIANDHQFSSITELWLSGDHYKWRALRANGVSEEYCTGSANDWAKFEKWAETVPYTMRNPLYHWTHMELKSAFGITKILSPKTAREIYEECNVKLQTPAYSARGLMKHYGVEAVCTTDDPIDDLVHHEQLKADSFEIKVLPTWRPDKAMAIDNVEIYKKYLDKLGEKANININSFDKLIEALRVRHDYFASVGCKLSDHGVEEFYAEQYSKYDIDNVFASILARKSISCEDSRKFKSAVLYECALMNWEKGWTQQFHFGALRNNNTRLFDQIGADTGFDSIGDLTIAKNMSVFLNRLDKNNHLAKTILYNLNPKDNYVVATMAGNFQDGTTAGKIQFGSGWWFLDQKDGMEAQLNTLSNLGLLSRFVGMLTDSRSFISYPRHDYFRRILCNLVGRDVESGLLPSSELPFLQDMVKNISYYNAKNYFNF